MTEIIAEIGSSHEGSKHSAMELIHRAAEAGADWAKFQLFSGDDLWYPGDERLFATRKVALPESWLPELKTECEDYGINFLCTPFSIRAVHILSDLGVKAFKVSSGDITYLPMLEEIGKTKLPVFLSVGASDYLEINQALTLLKDNNVVIMHCVPGYPVLPEFSNVRKILDLQSYYFMHSGWTQEMKSKMGTREIPVGLSSHLREYYVDAATVLYRIHTIEKHIDLPGRYSLEGGHSLDPQEFALFVAMVRDLEASMKTYTEFTPQEVYARENYRRNQDDWLRPVSR